MAKKGNDRADQDSPWKLILRQYFQEAIEFFFRDIANEIDWTISLEFLDKEFGAIRLVGNPGTQSVNSH